MKSILSICAAAAVALGLSNAATFDGGLIVDQNNGNAVVYDLGNNEYLGLLGLRFAEVGDTVDLASIQALSNSPSRITDIYVGTNNTAYAGDPAAFSLASSGVDVDELTPNRNDGRVFNAIFVRFTGLANLVFDNGNGSGGTSTLGTSVLIDENPLDPIPVPAAALLFAPVAGLFAVRRRKRA